MDLFGDWERTLRASARLLSVRDRRPHGTRWKTGTAGTGPPRIRTQGVRGRLEEFDQDLGITKVFPGVLCSHPDPDLPRLTYLQPGEGEIGLVGTNLDVKDNPRLFLIFFFWVIEK